MSGLGLNRAPQSNLHSALVSVPGIDENDAKVFKMTGVAGRERCFVRGGDTGDLDVADLHRPADLPLPGIDCGRGFRRSPVERQHAAAEDIVYGDIEGVMESVAPAAWGQKRQAETNFE